MTSRAEAKARNDTTYQGAPCARGHDGLRYTRKGACVECCKTNRPRRTDSINAAKRAWKAANPDKVRGQVARYNAKHGEETRAREAEALARKRAIRAALDRFQPLLEVLDKRDAMIQRDTRKLQRIMVRRQLTKRQRAALAREYKEARKANDLAGYREYVRNKKAVRLERERAGGPRASKAERMKLLEVQGYACAYCHATTQLELDHKWPVKRGGANAIWNLQYLCQPCNGAKGAMTDDEYRHATGLPSAL